MSDSRALLKAQALGDAVTSRELNSGMSEADREHYYLLTVALFVRLIDHHFDDEPSHDDIRAFVNETRHDFRDAVPPINAMVVEVLIRAIFGEEHLLDDVAPEEQYAAQLPVIRKIVGQSDLVQTRLDDYLTDAENLARDWVEA
ncbi:hypothetical protein FB566_1969 [Stackebrandtia endophytica]|uniref:Uncharacterized protein n=1 Tax=Stackebrandtia endophytica TaxID=1496996 RepID=A0A543AV31_9ACTN|nr:hypothetical protein [Stackebrandtia endophytica]TQL76440.1 hypothetical protein FB566_1969 [Stackebrandtia endophytica]